MALAESSSRTVRFREQDTIKRHSAVFPGRKRRVRRLTRLSLSGHVALTVFSRCDRIAAAQVGEDVTDAIILTSLIKASCPLRWHAGPARFAARREEKLLQVFVRDNNVDQALRVLKKKMQREGVFREMRRRRFYEKPSEQTARKKSDAVRRMRKLARKQAIRDGLIAAPVKKKKEDFKRPAAAGAPAPRP